MGRHGQVNALILNGAAFAGLVCLMLLLLLQKIKKNQKRSVKQPRTFMPNGVKPKERQQKTTLNTPSFPLNM